MGGYPMNSESRRDSGICMSESYESFNTHDDHDSYEHYGDLSVKDHRPLDHMAFEQVFGTFELGQQIFDSLSARDLLHAQRACSRFSGHVVARKEEFTLNDPVNRVIEDGPTKYTRTNFLADLLCPLTTYKESQFYSIHQLPEIDNLATFHTYSEPWRNMLFTRRPTRTVHILTGSTGMQPFMTGGKLPTIQSASEVQGTRSCMPDYCRVVNAWGVTMGEVIDAAMTGNRTEPFAVILGEADDETVETARQEFQGVLRRHRKMVEIAARRSIDYAFGGW